MAAPPSVVNVQEMKSMLNSIPGGAQAAVIIPDSYDAFANQMVVAINYVVSPSGERTYTVIGYLDFNSKTYHAP